MTAALQTPGLLSLAVGFTDNPSLPVELVDQAGALLAQREGEPEFLQYGTNQGRPGLRAAVAQRLARLEPSLSAERLADKTAITNGSQQALYLAIQALCDPGDIVLVDRPSYFVLLEMLTALGVQARSMPCDAAGRLDGPALRTRLKEMGARGELRRLRAVYFVSYFANPSSRSWSEEEKNELADALRERGLFVPVLEDAAYRDLYFENPYTARSVFSLAAWEDFPRVYFSTLTKSFATGLKVGFAIASEPKLLEKMLNLKAHHDFGTTNYNQALLECVLQNGGFDRQLELLRKVYFAKMDCLDQTLRSEGLDRDGWRWTRPAGGLYLWLEAPAVVDTGMNSPFCRACLEQRVIYVPGDICFGDQPAKNFVRLSFGVMAEGDLREAGARFVRAARSVRA